MQPPEPVASQFNRGEIEQGMDIGPFPRRIPGPGVGDMEVGREEGETSLSKTDKIRAQVHSVGNDFEPSLRGPIDYVGSK